MWVVVACVFGGIHPFHLNLTLQCLELHYFLRNFFIISVRVCRNMPCLIPDTDHLCLIFPLIILLEVCQFFDLSKQLGFIIDFVFLFPIPLISALFFFFFPSFSLLSVYFALLSLGSWGRNLDDWFETVHLFFFFLIFYWSMVDLQRFRCTAGWFSYTCTCILFLKSLSIIGYYKILTIVPLAIQSSFLM